MLFWDTEVQEARIINCFEMATSYQLRISPFCLSFISASISPVSVGNIRLFVDSFRKRERVTMKSLDEARKSFGTDEDILLVGETV